MHGRYFYIVFLKKLVPFPNHGSSSACICPISVRMGLREEGLTFDGGAKDGWIQGWGTSGLLLLGDLVFLRGGLLKLRSERWLFWFCLFVKEGAALAGGGDCG